MRSARAFLATLLTSAALPALLADFVPGRLYIADAAFENCGGPYPDDRDLIWEMDPATGESHIFAAVVHPACGVMSGLAFTPDGSRLRASNFLQSQILQFDAQGNRSVALGPNDGIYGPQGSNNLAYDPAGNFYVVNNSPNIMRFPAGGGPSQVFAGPAQGAVSIGPIAAGPSGDIYYGQNLDGRVIRYSPSGEPFPFPPLPSGIGSLVVDDRGDLYAWNFSGIYRYVAGNPDAVEYVAPSPTVFGSHLSLAFSPFDGRLYLANIANIYSLDRDTGDVHVVGRPSFPGRHGVIGFGMAVYVPEPSSAAPLALALGRLICRDRS